MTREKEAIPMIIPESKGYLVFDPSLCTGCHTCELVCSTFHNKGKYQPSLSSIQVSDDPFGGTIHNFEPMICYQCQDPKCMTACEPGAIYVDENTGARRVDETKCRDKCGDTQPCIEACAAYYDPPRIFFDSEKKVAVKCDLCQDDPQCVKWCSNGALKYSSLAKLKEAGSYQQDFEEPYTKDFGAPHIPFGGAEQTFEKIYPSKEK